MNNAELITELRGHIREVPLTLLRDAADALEAADEKIADYTAAVEALDDSNDAYIKENERLEKRIEELEARMNHKYCDVVNGCVMCDAELCDGKEKK